MQIQKKGNKIVVVGSNSFDDKSFVFGMLDAIKNQLDAALSSNDSIEAIYSSDFTGVSAFAKQWAELNHVPYKSHHFFSHEKTNPFFQQTQLSRTVIENDDFYQKGKDFFLSEGINMVITLPNASGVLGVQTENILRMATSAGLNNENLGILRAEELYASILNLRNQEQDQQALKKEDKKEDKNTEKFKDVKVTNLSGSGGKI